MCMWTWLLIWRRQLYRSAHKILLLFLPLCWLRFFNRSWSIFLLFFLSFSLALFGSVYRYLILLVFRNSFFSISSFLGLAFDLNYEFYIPIVIIWKDCEQQIIRHNLVKICNRSLRCWFSFFFFIFIFLFSFAFARQVIWLLHLIWFVFVFFFLFRLVFSFPFGFLFIPFKFLIAAPVHPKTTIICRKLYGAHCICIILSAKPFQMHHSWPI